MADFCNQCARDMGFPEGDLKVTDKEPLQPGHFYIHICEGCGPCSADADGNCVDPWCDLQHGVKATSDRIMQRYLAIQKELSGNGFWMAINEIATEECGEIYDFDIIQVHDSCSVHVWAKKPPVDIIDEGFSALASLQDMHEGDEQEVLDMLKELETALQYAQELEQTIIDMDKWVGENEGMGPCEYVDYDKEVNTTRSYQIAKELTRVNKV
jgi:hypothetical protein